LTLDPRAFAYHPKQSTLERSFNQILFLSYGLTDILVFVYGLSNTLWAISRATFFQKFRVLGSGCRVETSGCVVGSRRRVESLGQNETRLDDETGPKYNNSFDWIASVNITFIVLIITK
jgi:hypothetical protein